MYNIHVVICSFLYTQRFASLDVHIWYTYVYLTCDFLLFSMSTKNRLCALTQCTWMYIDDLFLHIKEPPAANTWNLEVVFPESNVSAKNCQKNSCKSTVSSISARRTKWKYAPLVCCSQTYRLQIVHTLQNKVSLTAKRSNGLDKLRIAIRG